ncbi:MAG: ABC transporter permease [Phycisphaerales bacterium]
MWSYLVRRLLYYIPLYLCILLALMLLLRIDVDSAVAAQLGKNATPESIAATKQSMGLDQPFYKQYGNFLWDVVTLSFDQRSWDQKRPVGEMIRDAIPPTMMITIPELLITAVISIAVGLVCSFNRGRLLDRTLMIAAVLGMSVSYLVYIIIGQYFGAYVLGQRMGITPFEIEGYSPIFPPLEGGGGAWFEPGNWVKYCALPVIIGVIVAMGYDTRFYRAVMVEECTRDYITTAVAKGATAKKIMFVHMLKNAMIPIVTRVMISLPFLIAGEILVEMYFNVPGMGRTMINAIISRDFPVVQATVAVFAAVVIITVILTDVCYAIVDPRVRLS